MQIRLQKRGKMQAYQNVSSVDIIECFSKATGRDLSGFFKAWLDGKVVIK